MKTAKSRIIATAFALASIVAAASTANAASDIDGNTATAGYLQVAHLVGKNDRLHADYRDGHRHGQGQGGYVHGKTYPAKTHHYEKHGYKKHGYKKHGYRKHGYAPYVPACHPVSKIRYDRYGYKVKVIKTMCYSPYGEPYIVRGSRRIVPLHRKHVHGPYHYTDFGPGAYPYWHQKRYTR